MATRRTDFFIMTRRDLQENLKSTMESSRAPKRKQKENSSHVRMLIIAIAFTEVRSLFKVLQVNYKLCL